MIGRALRELSLPTETGMWVMAIRSGIEWQFDPGPDDVLSEGDVLLVRGPEEGVTLLRELAGAPGRPEPDDDDAPPLSELDRAVDILVELKDLSEAAVGLAYSSILFNNRALAAEVGALEARSDTLHDELESWVLRAAPEARNPDELRGLLRLGSASESMCDAARDLTWYVEHGEPLHPVIQIALEEAEEISAETVVEPGTPADGKSLKELRLETETGMFVLAVQRGAAVDLPAARTLRAAGRRPADRRRTRGGRRGARRVVPCLRSRGLLRRDRSLPCSDRRPSLPAWMRSSTCGFGRARSRRWSFSSRTSAACERRSRSWAHGTSSWPSRVQTCSASRRRSSGGSTGSRASSGR